MANIILSRFLFIIPASLTMIDLIFFMLGNYLNSYPEIFTIILLLIVRVLP
jgi:hypothetical protein